MEMEPIALVVVVERITAAGITPLFDKLKLDKFYLMYVAWVLAAVLVFLTGYNMFEGLLPGVVGQVVTAIVAGGGANLLHDVTDKTG